MKLIKGKNSTTNIPWHKKEWSKGTGKPLHHIFSTIRKGIHKNWLGEFCSPNFSWLPF